MVLKSYQQAIQLGRIYEVSAISIGQIGEQLSPNLFVNSGTVNVYGANGATAPTTLGGFTLNAENMGVGGNIGFSIIPRYITIAQNAGTTTELVVSGLNVTDLGAI